MQTITESLAVSLNVARASIWFYNADRSAIVCSDLFEHEGARHSAGIELKAADFPAYFQYLTEERTLPAHDAQTDPSTFEFSEVYLKPLGIVSMLDAPIRVRGRMIGVICCEQVGARREWSFEEQAFVGNVTDVLARAFQAHERARAQITLEIMNAQLEEQIEKRTNELSKALAQTAHSAKMVSLGEMAGGIAHEINTPLNTIMFLADQLRSEIGSEQADSMEMDRLACQILDTSVRIAKIVQGLRSIARDESNGEFEIVDAREIVDQTLDLCQQRLYDNSINLDWIRPDNSISLSCQPVQISQVLLNLLNNAFDSVAGQKKPWITIELSQSDEDVTMRVSNSGPPIPEHIRKKLFQPFFTTKPPGQGVGLGLSISQGIVRQHKGQLLLETDREHTCFAIKLGRKALPHTNTKAG